MLTMTTAGEKLRDARRRAMLTQEELSVKSGVGIATISRIEKGHVDEPHFSTLRRLAEPLGVEPRDLLSD